MIAISAGTEATIRINHKPGPPIFVRALCLGLGLVIFYRRFAP
jgi:hypothetical protein